MRPGQAAVIDEGAGRVIDNLEESIINYLDDLMGFGEIDSFLA